MRNIYLFALMVFLVSCGNQNNAPKQNEATTAGPDGRQLFSINCASCHAVHKDLTGPALAGVQERWPDKKLLYRYIKNSQEVIAGNEYAKGLWLKYNKTLMTPFPNLTDGQIDAILQYIENQPEP